MIYKIEATLKVAPDARAILYAEGETINHALHSVQVQLKDTVITIYSVVETDVSMLIKELPHKP